MEKVKNFFNSHWQKIAAVTLGVAAALYVNKRGDIASEISKKKRPSAKRGASKNGKTEQKEK